MTEKISIVVPTRNRGTWVRRLMNYYAFSEFRGHVLIGDSSDELDYDPWLALLAKERRLRVKVVECGNLNQEMAALKCLEEVASPYVALCNDDDVVLCDGLNSGVSFLESNPDCVGFVGRASSLRVRGDGPHGTVTRIDPYPTSAFMEATAADRLRSFFTQPMMLNNCLAKTADYLEAYRLISELPTYHQSYIFGEYIQAISFLGKGKVAFLDIPYACRQGHASQFYSQLDFEKLLVLEDLPGTFSKVQRVVSNAFRGHTLYEGELDDQTREILKMIYQTVVSEAHRQISRLAGERTFRIFVSKLQAIVTLVFHRIECRLPWTRSFRVRLQLSSDLSHSSLRNYRNLIEGYPFDT